jgi:bla regulator protein BlaR1
MIPASFAPATSHLLQSTLFAGAVALINVALGHNQARVRYWLWLVASYKFLLPFSWLVIIGHYFQFHTVSPMMPSALSFVADVVSRPILLTSVSSTDVAPNHAHLVQVVAWSVWACGFVMVAADWFLQRRRIRTILGLASPLHLNLSIRVVSTAARLEPGVFGVFSPVLLLPQGINARLTEAQLETVLIHELCHVRRRDNLTAAIHMLVEALFWFHPLVWWLGNRLVRERERACDEEVLQSGGQSQIYAESILKVCQLYLEPPLNCVSGVTGSNLKERIRWIMKGHIGVGLSVRKKVFLATAGIAVLVVPVFAGMLGVAAQVPAKQQMVAPVPAKLIQAKTVFIENQSGFDRARDELAQELGNWNRLHIVYDKTRADLVVILTGQNTQRTIQITFVDPATGDKIWTNSMPWSERGAVRDLLDDLKQRIEQQDHQSK